ncbi:hypothetical protein FSP39_005993 [Pinctada imbricata]|uniref:Cytochrome b5 heme-binding domain-containing protein n=1 Tax=Pinctada imbricata TaxID=66713 RepID=A0AA89BNQ7_PINIB|nr:hypothetical protein FSP39_005993 [Pinctada imbricata]
MDIYSIDINKAEDLKGQLIPRMETDRTDTSPVREILSELNLGQYTEDQKPRFYRLKEVAAHSDFCSCWIVVHDNVYDITDFLHEHPGGWDVLMENAGTDATVAFDDKGHSKDAKELLSQYKIGELVHVSMIITNTFL